jgi:hypothetical protein
MQHAASDRVVSASDRDHLTHLLALVEGSRRWALEHRHAPLLCALGIIDAPDADYAEAAHRRFADPSETRRRALALIDELTRERREQRHEQWRGERVRRRAGGPAKEPEPATVIRTSATLEE